MSAQRNTPARRPITPAGPKIRAIATTATLLAFALAALPATAETKTLELPPDGVALKASPLPGYPKAQAYCVMCHSAEYMLYQPPTAARPYWESMVRRMQQVFKAPLDDADIPDLVDYLVKTYGNEQPPAP
jgi:hypothetical protein